MRKLIHYIILFAVLVCAQMYAGKFGKPHYVDYLKDKYASAPTTSYDSLGNLWYGTRTCLYKINVENDSIEYIDKLARGKDTIWYDNIPPLRKYWVKILFHGETALTNLRDTLFYLTPDSIMRIDASHPVMKKYGTDEPTLDRMCYLDSAYYFFLVSDNANGFKGMFKIDERTHKFERVLEFTTKYNLHEVIWPNRYLKSIDSLLIYPSAMEGIVYFNPKTQEAEYVSYNELISDSIKVWRNDFYENGNLHFVSEDHQYYKVNLRTLEHEITDLSNSPIIQNHYTDTAVSYIYIEEVNEKSSLMGIYIGGLRYGYEYLLDSAGNWSFIDRSNLSGLRMSFIRQFSSDKEKIWYLYYENEEPYVDENGKEYYYYFISYNIFEDSVSVEETEAMPTALLTKVYPNPSKKTINIEFFLHPSFREDVSFEIYDYMGRKIKELDDSYEYNAAEAWGTKTVNVESIDSGIYYLVIDNGNEKRSIGFAVE